MACSTCPGSFRFLEMELGRAAPENYHEVNNKDQQSMNRQWLASFLELSTDSTVTHVTQPNAGS